MKLETKSGLIALIVAAVCVFLIGQLLWFFVGFSYAPDRSEFQPDVWQQGSELDRAMMLSDLAARLEKERPTRAEVIELLGTPDNGVNAPGALEWTNRDGQGTRYRIVCRFARGPDGTTNPAAGLEAVRVFPGRPTFGFRSDEEIARDQAEAQRFREAQ